MSKTAELLLELKAELEKVYQGSEILEITVNRAAWEAIKHTTTETFLYDVYNTKGAGTRKEIVGIPIKLENYSIPQRVEKVW